jgi:hypothetical protein
MLNRGPVVRTLTWLGLVSGAILALAGGIVLNGSRLILVAMAGAMAAGVGYGATNTSRAASIAGAWKAAAGTVAAIFVIAGAVVLASGAVVWAVGGVAVVMAGGLWLLTTGWKKHFGRGTPCPTPPPDDDPAALLPLVRQSRSHISVSLLPTAALGSEWLRTSLALASGLEPSARHAIIRRRAETLDELERRDPVGFARWLAAGPTTGNDPAAFVHGDRTLGSDAA